MEFINAILDGSFEISYAILFVALLIYQTFTSMKREEKLNNKIEEQDKIILDQLTLYKELEMETKELIKEVRFFYFKEDTRNEAFKKWSYRIR